MLSVWNMAYHGIYAPLTSENYSRPVEHDSEITANTSRVNRRWSTRHDGFGL